MGSNVVYVLVLATRTTILGSICYLQGACTDLAYKLLGNAGNLRLQTLVNGEVRQESNTNDQVFSIEDLISFLSQGTTLQRGTVIMTGTPGGLASEGKPPRWLKNGDIVEVRIEGLGSVKNRLIWEE